MRVHSSINHNSQKVETTQISINWWMDKHNGISFGHKNKLNTDTCYNMDEPWRHYAKWKKPVTKRTTYYDSLYMKYPV